MPSGARLTGLDSSFLHLEQGPVHMHVASVLVFAGEPPPYEEFRDHIASRLHLVPRFRQKLRFVPFAQGRPVWVDDPRLNLDYHVRHTALPEPGGDQQLRTLAARIFSQRLDRGKPLWELWLVDGLEGERFAIVGKSHHCLVDGISGMDITAVLFDADPDPGPPASPPPEWVPRPEPTDAQLLGEALLERAVDPVEAVRGVRALFRAPRRAAKRLAEGALAAGSFARTSLGAHHSLLNERIGPYRRFAWAQASLDDLKRVKDEVGGTVNDVILAAVAGALGRYLRLHGEDTTGLTLKAMVPVSIRGSEEHGELGNRVSAIQATLPVGVEDPAARLRQVSAEMGDLKASKQAMGASLLTQLTDFAPPTILGQASRIQAHQRFFNLVVTNVPGPQFPLYLLGRRLLAVYPLVPLAANQTVCFGVISHDGAVNFGIVGDYDQRPDLDRLAAALRDSLAELAELAPGTGRRGRGRARAQRPRSRKKAGL